MLKRQRRRPVAMVVAFDRHRDYRPAETDEASRARAILATLCPGDTVALFEINEEAQPLGDRVNVRDLTDIDDLVLRIEQRRPPRQYKRINRQVIQAAASEWGRPELLKQEDLLRVLVYFTRDLESRAPRNAYVEDFNWARPPYWLGGHALAALFKPITSDEKVVAWETFIVATPEGVQPDDVEQGLRVDLGTWLQPVRIKPKVAPKTAAPKPKPQQKVALGNRKKYVIPADVLPDPKAIWQRHDEDAVLWDPSLLPWILSGALGLLLALTLGWVFVRAGRAGQSQPSSSPVAHMTLLVRDKIHDSVVSQERVRLESSLRVGASMTSDVVVPGPYSLEIVPGVAGATPRVRSTNSLGLEVHRVGSSRALRATESVPVQLRSGDHINLGGGHILEVKFS